MHSAQIIWHLYVRWDNREAHSPECASTQGMELGEADDIVFNKSNSKQQSGAIGLLTDNVVNRMQLYEQAVVLALIRFKNETLYQPQEQKVDF